MKKLFFIMLILAVFVVTGCNDDTDTNVNTGETAEATETATKPVLDSCRNPDIIERACTMARQVDGHLDLTPYAAADWMLKRARAANEQCLDWGDIDLVYQIYMKELNSGSDPDDVKVWFMDDMADLVHYDPLWNCPGGCYDV